VLEPQARAELNRRLLAIALDAVARWRGDPGRCIVVSACPEALEIAQRAGALALLALFYLSWLPTRGVYEPGAEGNYLLVNKNLVEAAAVAVVFVFRTGRIAGLDLLRGRERAGEAPPVAEATR